MGGFQCATAYTRHRNATESSVLISTVWAIGGLPRGGKLIAVKPIEGKITAFSNNHKTYTNGTGHESGSSIS
ncbi:hypothetical protein H9L39_10761 [Fusarium oxysporum f. sp. albedinis]|nr:hypothetical protein H9L39_10761 [Fusarium oxysporum f. sp. albedinis]